MIEPFEQGTLAIALLRHMRARRENVLGFQRQRLQTLIRHAASRVPYYRRLLASHGISPDDIRTAADLLALPITSKHDLHAQPVGDVLAAGVNPSALLRRTTGGSTGMPLVVRRTAAEEHLMSVARRRLSKYFGYGLRDRLVVVSVPAPRDAASTFSRMMRPLKLFGILEVQHVSCFLPLADIAAELARRQPAVLGGYPSVLARVGQHLLEERSTAIRPRVVLTGGEVRTTHMRDQIRTSFGTDTFDTYGSHEFNRIAYECRQTGAYHVCDDTVIVEVVDQNGRPVREGERGEVVGTGLFSLAMPFIRYRLGDVVIKGRDAGCECGAPFSTIRSIQGRTVDYFPLPDGRLLHPYELAAATVRAQQAVVTGSRRHERPFSWIREYRYVQDRIDRIVLFIVPVEEPPAAEMETIDRAIRDVLGPAVTFDVQLRSRLDPQENGKFGVYRSLVTAPGSLSGPVGAQSSEVGAQ